MANDYQVIVVGGGPAGASAAHELALRGHRTLLLERAALPRYKACGGGLTPKAVARLPFPVSDLPHVRLERIAFRLRGGSPVTWDLSADFPFYMIMRTDLDARLVQSAIAAGVAFRSAEPALSVRWAGNAFVVETDNDDYRAPYVVGADGATGIVRRSVGIAPRDERVIALECELQVPDGLLREHATTALFDVEAVPDGYGWIFPKTTHLSVGVGSLKARAGPLRSLFGEFLLRHGLVARSRLDDLAVHVHPLPMATVRERARVGNALLVGDAAGVADGFGGEGISYALSSGQLAARMISKALTEGASVLAGYDAELDRLIRQDQGQSNLMGRIVRRFPDAAYHILTSVGEGRSVLVPLMLGEISFRESLRRLPRLVGLGRSGK